MGNKPRKSVFKPGRAVVLSSGYVELLEDTKDHIRHAQIRAVVGAAESLSASTGTSTGKSSGGRIERAGERPLSMPCRRPATRIPRHHGFFASEHLVYAGLLRRLDRGPGKTPTTCWRIGRTKSPTGCWRNPPGAQSPTVGQLQDSGERLWYARKAVQHAWSRATLVHQIELDLYGREGKAITNFPLTLPAPQSDLAQQTLFRARIRASARHPSAGKRVESWIWPI